MKDKTVIDKLAAQGATLVGDSPEHFREFIASETAKWGKVIKDAGVPVQK
jgi:tripartite-type tricarboxylate transporter receptor subunit TctC